MIPPHGEKLVKKIVPFSEKEEILKNQENYPKIFLDSEQVKDVKNIAEGVYSPLEGFLKEEDFLSVCERMRLKDGTVWPIPIVLDISKEDIKRIEKKEKVLLVSKEGKPIAILKDFQIYSNKKDFFVESVFGTKDRNHPGVNDVYEQKEFLIGGEIELLDEEKDYYPEHYLTPTETREIFQKKGWHKVAAFQTRNVPHRGHEFLQKETLKVVDGLFIQPVIGEKKLNDFKDEYIIVSYDVLIERYYPKDKVVFGILPLKMRYAGPREAVFHGLVRKNFGCTHFIVGRDHAGVGNYYPPFAAQEIFNNFKKEEIGIEVLKYPEVVYCPSCKKHVFLNDCPHQEKIFFSGTKLRNFIKNKVQPPSYLIRPEVYYFLTHSYNSLVDEMYKTKKKNKKGFVLWFTGLSQAGKTTIADRVSKILKEKGLKIERLDGDVFRQYLSFDLGFSKEDREENIRRVGVICKLLSKNGFGVIASFISPYKKSREEVRKKVENFIEVFCNCPLEVCEKRDDKGLYQKARRGEIQNFTGVSDPYEPPENPEIELKTDNETIEECVQKVISYLKENDFI